MAEKDGNKKKEPYQQRGKVHRCGPRPASERTLGIECDSGRKTLRRSVNSHNKLKISDVIE